MKSICLYFSVFVLISSCNQSAKYNPKESNLQNDIIGQWGGSYNPMPIWDITMDSIYYFSHNKAYPYTLENNDLVLIENGHKVRLSNIIVSGDTLVFENPPGYGIAAIRVKEHHAH